MKYIQFIGTQRSGSNLLRVMLNQIPEIAAPHPPHILKTFFPLLKYYGNLEQPENFYLLVSDVCEWVNKNPVPWEDITLEPERIISLCEKHTLLEVFIRIYEQKAIHDRAEYWCCKSMESIYHVKEIEAAGLRPFYIYIYRDGRDVALSFKKAIVGPKHIYHLAIKWKEEQKLSLELINTLDESRYVIVRYEELIAQPKIVLQEICRKLNIEFTENIFDYFHSHESLATASSGKMWQNLSKPIISNNFNKFKSELSEFEIRIFERVAWDFLRKLRYDTLFYPDVKNEEFSESELAEFKRENNRMKQAALDQADKEEIMHRAPQQHLLDRIKTRMIEQPE